MSIILSSRNINSAAKHRYFRWENKLTKADIEETCAELIKQMRKEDQVRRSHWDFLTAEFIIKILTSSGTSMAELTDADTCLTRLLRMHVDFETLRPGNILPNDQDPHRTRCCNRSEPLPKSICARGRRGPKRHNLPSPASSVTDDASSVELSTPSETHPIDRQRRRCSTLNTSHSAIAPQIGPAGEYDCNIRLRRDPSPEPVTGAAAVDIRLQTFSPCKQLDVSCLASVERDPQTLTVNEPSAARRAIALEPHQPAYAAPSDFYAQHGEFRQSGDPVANPCSFVQSHGK